MQLPHIHIPFISKAPQMIEVPHELTQYEQSLIASNDNPMTEFDNEWIKFMQSLADNKSVLHILSYIKSRKWTDRQKAKIMSYTRVVLGPGLSTGYLPNNLALRILRSKKDMIDIDLALGMTRLDANDEFLILIDMIDLHFNIESNKSIGGKFLNTINKNRHVIETEERHRQPDEQKEQIG